MVLEKYRKGESVQKIDEAALHRLASIGFAKMGTDVELRNGKIRLTSTAKPTSLGKKIILMEIK
ncbi:MAG: hypothetical protein ABSB80_09920 [Methanoregula sp.]|uniref:hypothetical protein n=1 Tax=Methanoregula sp. TaxID=2052170 RepID=UPI003D0C2B37